MKTIHNSETTHQPRTIEAVTQSLKKLLCSYGDVAYVVGVTQDRTVKNWAEKGIIPSDPVMTSRLQVVEKLASTVQDERRPWVSAAWLIGPNPLLSEDAPRELLQSLQGSPDDEVTVQKLQFAAEQFAARASEIA